MIGVSGTAAIGRLPGLASVTGAGAARGADTVALECPPFVAAPAEGVSGEGRWQQAETVGGLCHIRASC